ncbi:MAG TPA: hypothetical protein VLF60_04745 [Candidatus Saccharimonadales bacterium]|nr:hypothetical protein [Candidatus Saccharimonadales bacterium]
MSPEENKATDAPAPQMETPAPPPTTDTPGGFTPGMTGGKAKNRKKLYIIIGVVLVVVIAAIAGWLFYSQPRKVMADALGKTVGAQSGVFTGNVTYNTKGSSNAVKVSVDFTGQGNKSSSQLDAKGKVSIGAVDFTLDTSFLSADKASYFKINNAKQIGDVISALAGGTYKDAATAYTPLLTKIDNKWVKIDQQDATADVGKCTTALDSFTLSKSDQNALEKLFASHEFIKAKKTGKPTFSEVHYNLSFEGSAVEPFLTGAENLDSFKAIKDACKTDDTIKGLKQSTSTSDAKDTKMTAELWVNKWTHKPTKIMITTEDSQAKLVFSSNIDLGKKVNVSKPASSTNLSDIIKDFQTQFLQNTLKSSLPAGSSAEDQAALDQLLNSDGGNLQ